MPVIAGEREGLLALWAVKAGLMEPEPIDERTAKLYRWGHLMEPVIAQAYTEETGRPLVRVNRMLQSREWPVARASLDRRSARKGERRGVEIKNTRSPRWMGYTEIPGDVRVQCQWQMYVADLEVVDVAVLSMGSDLHILEEPRDDGWIDDLLYLGREFWDHVQTRTQPERVDGDESTRQALHHLYPSDTGVMLPRTAQFVDLARELAAARALVKEAGAEEDRLSNTLAAMLADASGVDGVLSYHRGKDFASVNYHTAVDAAQEAGIDLAPYLAAATTTRSTRPLRVILKEGPS